MESSNVPESRYAGDIIHSKIITSTRPDAGRRPATDIKSNTVPHPYTGARTCSDHCPRAGSDTGARPGTDPAPNKYRKL